MGSKNKNKKKAGDSDGAGENGARKNQTIDDPRFSKAHFDPRFRRTKHHKAKVAIDSRFDGVFTDKRFATSSAPVDKRGKPKKSSENALRRYYHLEEEEDVKKVKNAKKNLKREKVKEESESESEGDEKAVAKLRESSVSESVSESDGSSAETSSTGSSDDEDEVDDEADDSVEVENVPVIEKETHRLAVVNMDWSQVKAVDLYVMLSSCLPKGSNGGQIKSVSVYPSEFGLKRMEEEAIHGPVALFEDEKKKKIDSDDANDDDKEEDDDNKDDDDSDDEQVADDLDDDEIDDLDDDEIDDDEIDDLDDEDEIDDLDDNDEMDDLDDDEDEDDDDDGDEIDTEKVRAYEKSKLRYYYAAVECDSVATADYLYKNCDGVEFERSSNVLDLRFIPDSMEFKHPPRDVATEAPADYEGLDFHTRALQQSNAVLSWDDDEPHRVKTLRRKFNENQLAELELKEFLASDESESDEDEKDDQDPLEKRKKKHEKYRNLLLSGDGSEKEDEDDDEGQDMEVTFNTGLEEISKKILEKKDKGSETVWEAYLRKKKEKKKSRKHRSKNSSDDDSDESDDPVPVAQTDDFFEEDSSVKKSKKVAQGKKKREEKKLEDKETEASRAELELLLADENGADKKVKGYKIKQKKAKGKKGEEAPAEAKLPTVDLDDPRFSALFNNPGFALDPTEPQFQRSATYFRQLAQKQHKNLKEEADIVPVEPSAQKEEKHSIDASQKEKHELSSIVKSLKLKSQQLPLPSSAKMKKDKMKSNGSTSEKKKRKLSSSDGTMKKKARE